MNSLFFQKNTSFLLKKASKIMNEKTLIEYFYRFEKEKANRPFLHQPFGNS